MKKFPNKKQATFVRILDKNQMSHMCGGGKSASHHKAEEGGEKVDWGFLWGLYKKPVMGGAFGTCSFGCFLC